MLINRVSSELLNTKRIDPDYYTPQYIEDEHILRAYGSEVLGKTGRFFVGPFGSKLPSNLYLEEGIPLFRVGNVGAMEVILHGMAYLDPIVHEELSASEVRSGDMLIVKASVGEKICKVPSEIPVANITQHIIAIRPNGTVDSDFITAFLFGQYGKRQLMRRSLGSIIQYLGVIDARDVLYPIVEKSVQTYIGDKVRQAERLRNQATTIEKAIKDQFTFLTRNLPKSKKAWGVSSDIIDPYRINAGHYDSVVLEMIKNAKREVELIPLSDLTGQRRISGGATPLGATYKNEGVFFVRVQNVKPYRLDTSDAAYISSQVDEELSRSRCLSGDIVLTITGYPGVASIVMEDDLPLNINQHSVRFNVRNPLSAEYVVAALNSQFVKKQVDRLSIGATRDALDYKSVKDLLIPILGPEIQSEIQKDIILANFSVRYSGRLTTAAKLLIEALIEGKVSEQDLIDAQEALEHGDSAADRALLARLTPKGMDAEAPPLFADLDALYTALAATTPAEEA